LSAERIVRLAGRGDGVTASGRYVAGVAPGDIIDAGGVLVEAGPHRQVPPCRHFPACGGCQLQQVDDAAYADWVAGRALYALEQQGIAVPEVAATHLSPPRSRRRASLRAVKRGRAVELGFNAPASHRLVDMRECHILRPELFALVAPLRALFAEVLGDGRTAVATLTLTASGVDLLLSNIDAGGRKAAQRLAAFALEQDLARLSVESGGGVDDVVVQRMPEVAFGGVTVALPHAAFLQATEDGEAALQAAVVEACAGAAGVADLFCGLGTFALPLSKHVRVEAIDAAGPAVTALAQTGRVATAHRDLFRRPLTAAELVAFDAVVFDPPRAGAAAQVAEIAASQVPVVVAVSCNPATFARDAGVLAAAGYRCTKLWPVGQFRWSTHVELVARFQR
jgi:23S rRNA (uracil1939-C5)-methyltransferase